MSLFGKEVFYIKTIFYREMVNRQNPIRERFYSKSFTVLLSIRKTPYLRNLFKNFITVKIMILSRYHSWHALPIVHHRVSILPNRPSG